MWNLLPQKQTEDEIRMDIHFSSQNVSLFFWWKNAFFCCSRARRKKSFKLTFMLAVNKSMNECKTTEGCAAPLLDSSASKGKNSSICYFHTNLIVLKLLLCSLSVFLSLVDAQTQKRASTCYCHSNMPKQGLLECLVILTRRPSVVPLSQSLVSIGFFSFSSGYSMRRRGRTKRQQNDSM